MTLGTKRVNEEKPSYLLVIHKSELTEKLKGNLNEDPSKIIKPYHERDALLEVLAKNIENKVFRTIDLNEENKLRYLKEETNPERYHVWFTKLPTEPSIWKDLLSIEFQSLFSNYFPLLKYL